MSPAVPYGKNTGLTDPTRTPGIVRFNRWAAAVALILGNFLMMFMILSLMWMLNTLGGIAHRLSTDTSTPGPLVTGCPFGDTECGG